MTSTQDYSTRIEAAAVDLTESDHILIGAGAGLSAAAGLNYQDLRLFQDWPQFRWDRERLADPLAEVRHKQGRLTGHMEALGFRLRQEAVLQTLTTDVLKSSEIEGEVLDKAQVRSSIARHLGMNIGALKPADRHVEGIVEMTLDATRRYDQQLNEERLFAWHAALFPTGRSSMRTIRAGAWRDDRTGPDAGRFGTDWKGACALRGAIGNATLQRNVGFSRMVQQAARYG
jgi:hypothetical protein